MAYAAAGQTAIVTYWNVGKRIVEEEQNGRDDKVPGLQFLLDLEPEVVTLEKIDTDKLTRLAREILGK